jgi:hypothetical protein
MLTLRMGEAVLFFHQHASMAWTGTVLHLASSGLPAEIISSLESHTKAMNYLTTPAETI